MMIRHTQAVLSTVLIAVAIPMLPAQSASAKKETPTAGPNVLRIVEYGEYHTTDAATVLKPNWTLKKQTTDIQGGDAGIGFGIRYSVPGPYAGRNQVEVTVTLIGAFGGVSGPTGFEFKSACAVKDGKCIGEIISPMNRGPGPALTAGSYTFRVTYQKSTVEKTLMLK